MLSAQPAGSGDVVISAVGLPWPRLQVSGDGRVGFALGALGMGVGPARVFVDSTGW